MATILMHDRTNSIFRLALGLILLITIFACGARNVAIDKSVTYVEKRDQRMVILSPEHLRTMLGTSGKKSDLIYVGLGNMQYRFEGSTMSTMIEERYVPANLSLPLVIPCPRRYQEHEVFTMEFDIYCVESQEARFFRVDFEKRKIKALIITHIRPEGVMHLRDGTVDFLPLATMGGESLH